MGCPLRVSITSSSKIKKMDYKERKQCRLAKVKTSNPPSTRKMRPALSVEAREDQLAESDAVALALCEAQLE